MKKLMIIVALTYGLITGVITLVETPVKNLAHKSVDGIGFIGNNVQTDKQVKAALGVK